MTNSKNTWLVKWEYIIDKISQVMREHGKEIVVVNVDAVPDPVEQFKRYEKACETVKNLYEAVVTTSLPGEERIFWVYKNVQFYILYREEKIHVTGNQEMFRKILGE
jgi:hypothetical protein